MSLMFKSFYARSTQSRGDAWTSEEPSCTLQEFKDESDINNLVARYKQTGAFYDALAARNLGAQPRVPIFEDVSEIPDFAAAQEVINRGKAAFDALPPSVRSAFDNSLELFLAYVNDNAKNPDALREIGLVPKASTPRPMVIPNVKISDGVQGSKTPANVDSAPQQNVAASENASEK